ncbi:Palmitoyltransferase ZDHHC16B [Dictyocoela muelleri]|nr:Palmitoyltransferase ZDHHC16B [Dictyocoela muelleri]
MYMERIILKIIKYSETLLISTVIIYMSYNIYELVFSHGIYKLVPLYFLILSLYNYISLMFIQNQVPYEKAVSGVCDKCKKLQFIDSSHCEICNECFYKRDHHCMWIGRCVAHDNSREYYLFCLFFNVYLLLSINMSYTIRFLNVYLTFFITCFNVYLGYSIYKKEGELGFFDSYYELFFPAGERSVVNIFLPFIVRKSLVEES